MTRPEATGLIEYIVGATRDPERHIARAVPEDARVYILHSEKCHNSGRDMRLCPYSIALDRGIDPDLWIENLAVFVVIDDHSRLVPARNPFHPTKEGQP